MKPNRPPDFIIPWDMSDEDAYALIKSLWEKRQAGDEVRGNDEEVARDHDGEANQTEEKAL